MNEKPMRLIRLKFPCEISQISGSEVEIHLSAKGVSFPELSPNIPQAEAFDKAFGLSLLDHESILESIQASYENQLLLKTIKVQ